MVARYENVDSLADGITAVVLREVSRYLADLNPPPADGAADGAGADAGPGAGFAMDAGQARRRLLGLLVTAPPAPPPVTASLARAAGWPLPRRVAAVALAEHARDIPGPLPPGALADLASPRPCLLIPDPDGPGRLQTIEATLRAWLAPAQGHPNPAEGRAAGLLATAGPQAAVGPLAAVGPAVPLADAGGSLRWAGQALTLAKRGLADARDGIIWCGEHLATLVLLADADLAGTLSREVLAPLRRLRPEQADRLAATLLAWLESADDASAAARRLHVHPQTIRYRLRQLAGLFGDALTDPDARFRLLLALRARQLLNHGTEPADTESAAAQ
jgi:hypothetical protein